MIREKRQLIFIATAILLAIGFAMLVLRPLRTKEKTLRRSVQSHSLAADQTRSQAEQMPELIEKLKALEAQVGDYEQKIPQKRNYGVFLEQITEIMKQQQLREQRVQAGNETSLGELNCIPVSISCSGSLNQIFGFFQSIQGYDRVIRLERIELISDNQLSGNVTMRAGANIYYQSGKQAQSSQSRKI